MESHVATMDLDVVTKESHIGNYGVAYKVSYWSCLWYVLHTEIEGVELLYATYGMYKQ